MSQDINRAWLWIAGVCGALLVLLAVFLNLVWGVSNILPSVSLDLGVGTILFSVLFFLERRIVRRTNLRWVSALEELASRTGQDPAQMSAHFAGPVTAVNHFVRAVLQDSDYRQAWTLADPNWRICRAQAWLWNNSSHPLVAHVDKELAAEELAEVNSTHELWETFAETELEQFREIWSDPDLIAYGTASATRVVDDGEIVLLVDLSEHPDGAIAYEATEVSGVPFLVRQLAGEWVIANLVGDRLPKPGWPPDWRVGWPYWEKLLGDS